MLLLLLVLLGLVVLAEAAAAAAAALRMGIMEAGKGVAEDDDEEDEAFGSEEDDVSKALCAFDCLDRAMMIYYVCNGMETTGCNLYSLTHSPPASYSLTGPQLKYTRKNMKVSRLTLWNLQVSNVR